MGEISTRQKRFAQNIYPPRRSSNNNRRSMFAHRCGGIEWLLTTIIIALMALGWTADLAAATDCTGRLHPKGSHFGRPRFKASVVSVTEADTVYALLELEIPYTQLSFRKVGDHRESNFDLIVHIFQNDKLVTGDMWPQRITVPNRESLRGQDAIFEKDLTFNLNPGRYAFEVKLSEKRSGISGTICLGLDMPIMIPGRNSVSSLLIGECSLTGSIAELRADPRIVTRFYDTTDTVCAYLSLYHGSSDFEEVDLTWQLHSLNGNLLVEESLTFPAGEKATRMTWLIPIHDLWLDVHRITAHISAGDQKSVAQTTFSVLTESNTALTTFFQESLGVLQYIAEESEVKKLQLAAPRDRKRLWDEFWARRDPIPETDVNEYKDEFFRRVRRANEIFGSVRSGWQTDRGRIYITHGDPDEVTKDDYSSRGQPTEIWYYTHLRMRFVFIDRRGYGEFELIDSTW